LYYVNPDTIQPLAAIYLYKHYLNTRGESVYAYPFLDNRNTTFVVLGLLKSKYLTMGEKKENKRSEKKIGNESAKEKGPNFGLCACLKATYCTIYNRSWLKI